MVTLQMSTRALNSGSATDDSVYTALEQQLTNYGNQRDALVSRMNAMLQGAEFGGTAWNDSAAQDLTSAGWNLLNRVTGSADASGYSFEVSFINPTPGQGVVLFGTGPGC